jgi:hypothetical protein
MHPVGSLYEECIVTILFCSNNDVINEINTHQSQPLEFIHTECSQIFLCTHSVTSKENSANYNYALYIFTAKYSARSREVDKSALMPKAIRPFICYQAHTMRITKRNGSQVAA